MGEEVEAHELVFTVMFIMAVGTFVYHHLARLNLPYTVIMFVMGMLLGFSGYILPAQMQDYFDLLAEIPPRLIFHIFLPILIFEGAYGMKTHAFRQVFPQAALLAGPGLIMNTLFVACALKLIYAEWNWFTAILLGSILSATDPVAVVALLKDLGVDKRITALVDGEAIMNDGTAIIVFTLFVPAAAAGYVEAAWTAVLIQSIQLVFGGVVFGLFSGWLQVQCLKRTENELVRTCLTICGAFLSFYVADVWIECSGVLTLCFEGVYLAANFPSMFPGREGSMFNSTWHFMVHFANTILFALVGVIIARDAAQDFSFLDVGYILFLYAVIMVGRLGMIFTMRPALNRFSFKLGKSEMLLLTHGGLRGGVAATLALDVVRDTKLPANIGIDFLVLTCGIVLLTITVNATTSDYVVQKIGLKVKESNRLKQMGLAMHHISVEASRALRRIKSSKFVRTANWAEIEPLIEKIENPYAAMNERHEDEDTQFYVLLMRHFKTSLWKQRDTSHITEDVVRILTRVSADCIREGVLIHTAKLHREMRYPPAATFFHSIGLTKISNSFKNSQDYTNFGVLLAYLTALEEVEEGMAFYIKTKKQLEEAHKWLTEEREAVQEKIAHYVEEKPMTARSVVTAKAAEMVFSECDDAINQLHAQNGYSVPAVEALEHAIHHARHHIAHFPAEMQPPSPEAICKMGIFSSVPPNVVAEIATKCTMRTLKEGEELCLHQHEAEIAIVASGALSVLGRNDVTYGCGSVLGLPRSLTQRQTSSKYHAISDGEFLVITARELVAISDDSPILRSILLHNAGVDVAERLLSKRPEYHEWTFDNLRDMVQEGRVVHVPVDHYKYPAASGEIAVFLKGSSRYGLVGHHTEPFIVPLSMDLEWSENTLLFVLSPERGSLTRAVAQMSQMSSIVMEGDEAMTTLVHNPDLPVRQLSQILSTSRTDLTIDYNESTSATPHALFNKYQAEFYVELEFLLSVTKDYQSYADESSKKALTEGIDHVISFLARFCLQHFSAENKLYTGEQALADTWPDHCHEHDAFQRLVSEWMEKKSFFDVLCHEEIIEGMTDFAQHHFPIDHRDSHILSGKRPKNPTAATTPVVTQTKKGSADEVYSRRKED